MAHVLILNVALFVPVLIAGAVAAWFGWTLAGGGADSGDGGEGVVPPEWPSPVTPMGGVGPDDLARSA